MNIMQIMKQAQNVQAKLKSTQEELARMEIVGEAAGGAVKVTCDGQGRFKSIKLSPEAINSENPSSVDTDTIEMLEDIILVAVNDVINQVSKTKEVKLGKYTNGLGGLF